MLRSLSRFTSLTAMFAAGLLAMSMLGCSKTVERSEEVRPVRAVVVAPEGMKAVAEFSGDIQPRYESQLGFRVGGKLIARKVEVGSIVKRGQLLMQLDPTDLQLAQSQAKAAVSVADSNLALAKSEVERYRELRQRNFVSQALLDAKEAAYRSALAGHEQASAGLKVQANQSSYTNLTADSDGVITSLQAEVGQVVAAGTPIVKLARTGEKEVRVSIPEDQVDSLRHVSELTIRTWANPATAIEGHVREISPVADPVTRTYAAKISLPKAGPEVRLGMTAIVQFTAKAAAGIRLPLTALFNHKEGTAVWVVENNLAKLAPVQVAPASGNEILIVAGLNPGQTVVTAGVNQLRQGQKVSLLGSEVTAGKAAPQSAGAEVAK